MKQHIVIFLGVLLWLTTPDAMAQKSTELFIPIGKSPGISGKYTVIGTIDSVNIPQKIVFMSDSAGTTYMVRFAANTKVYLDKSKMKKTNKRGTISDCQKNGLCEVYYQSHQLEQEGKAEWIKIQVDSTGGM